MNDDRWDAAREEMQNEVDWFRHDALHEGNPDPRGCWICREVVEDHVRGAHDGETPLIHTCWTCAKVVEAFERTGESARDPDWRVDAKGYVVVPLTNGGIR